MPHLDEPTVPCHICTRPIPRKGPKLCDRCWELGKRIHLDRALARKILDDLEPHPDTLRIKCLRELMGYTQDGSSQTVKLFEDDATRDFFVTAGERSWCAGDMVSAIDAAVEALKNR